ncbi:ABC transporter permease [Inquilinus limosus]|uniref:ABC transporter permease n=1 Tax=Inquilinus limosus TaxID=171674 RepID=UPI003F156277
MWRRRERSPWAGVGTVLAKETADHLTSVRMRLLEALVFLTALGATYAALRSIRDTVGQDPFLFLNLFTLSQAPLPSFVAILGFLVPLVAIALSFDAVNGEFSRRTLGRLLSQPIYRDGLIFGKFAAALLTLVIALVALWLAVIGLGILLLGLPPSTEEIVRMAGFLLATIVFGGVWLAVGLLFSTLFRSPATAALSALAVWLVVGMFWAPITSMIADLVSGPLMGPMGPNIEHVETARALSRISPNGLFAEITVALLNPATRTLGPVLYSDLDGALIGAPLPAGQSFLLVWPQFPALIAAVIVLFVLAYLVFLRQEVRA